MVQAGPDIIVQHGSADSSRPQLLASRPAELDSNTAPRPGSWVVAQPLHGRPATQRHGSRTAMATAFRHWRRASGRVDDVLRGTRDLDAIV